MEKLLAKKKLLEEESKFLEELLGELQREPCLATENEQVGEVCSTSKYIFFWEVCVYLYFRTIRL